MKSNEQRVHTFKILTIGESGVGKTCILRRYVENKFLKNHLATIGIDFKSKLLEIDGCQIKLKVWDTAGQERFRNITNQYYKGADGIILVFDLTDKKSFDKINEWLNQIRINTKEEEISIVLVGNKCDAEVKNVEERDIKQIAEETNLAYFETSALTGHNVNECFLKLTRLIMEKRKISSDSQVNEEDNINIINTSTKKKKGGCC